MLTAFAVIVSASSAVHKADDGAGTLGAADFNVNGFEYEITSPWTAAVVRYVAEEADVVIPQYAEDPADGTVYKVDEIRAGAFSGRTDLTSVDAEWIRDVGGYAFAGCAGLKWVYLIGAWNIAEGAFAGCANLGAAAVSLYTYYDAGAFEPGTVVIKMDPFIQQFGGTVIAQATGSGEIEIRIISNTYLLGTLNIYDPSSWTEIPIERTGIETWIFDPQGSTNVYAEIPYYIFGEAVEVIFITEKHGNIEYKVNDFGWTPLPDDGKLWIFPDSVFRLRVADIEDGYTAVMTTGPNFSDGTAELKRDTMIVNIAFLPAEYAVTLPEYADGTFVFSQTPIKTSGNKVWFTYGTDVTIAAVSYPSSGYAFEWASGGDVSGNTITFTVTGDTVLEGNAIPKECQIFVNVPPGIAAEYTADGITLPVPADGTIYVKFGTQVTISAADAEKGFAWNKGIGLSIVGNDVSFVAKGDRDIAGTYPPAAADTTGTVVIAMLVILSAIVTGLLIRSVRQ